MNEQNYSFELLTPSLCHGADPKFAAEMREPSIRGQLRIWHTILWGATDTDLCFGCAKPSPVASKTIIRVQVTKESKVMQSGVPHKNWESSKVQGMASGSKYCLKVSFRLLTGTPGIPERVAQTVRCWLLLGTIGQRSTRAFGSVWPQDRPPADRAALENELRNLLKGKRVFRLASQKCDSIQMSICTDTLKVPEYFGSIKPRIPSPLKMKFVRLDGQIYLLLHAEKAEIIDGALRLLREGGKRLADFF